MSACNPRVALVNPPRFFDFCKIWSLQCIVQRYENAKNISMVPANHVRGLLLGTSRLLTRQGSGWREFTSKLLQISFQRMAKGVARRGQLSVRHICAEKTFIFGNFTIVCLFIYYVVYFPLKRRSLLFLFSYFPLKGRFHYHPLASLHYLTNLVSKEGLFPISAKSTLTKRFPEDGKRG